MENYAPGNSLKIGVLERADTVRDYGIRSKITGVPNGKPSVETRRHLLSRPLFQRPARYERTDMHDRSVSLCRNGVVAGSHEEEERLVCRLLKQCLQLAEKKTSAQSQVKA